jgi:hypothetical protein
VDAFSCSHSTEPDFGEPTGAGLRYHKSADDSPNFGRAMNDNLEKAQKLIAGAANLIGSGVGGALQFYATGPGESAAASVAGTLLGQLLVAGADMTLRVLSPRESMRVGAAYGFSGIAIKERLDRGEKPRDDGFFTPDATNRSAAEELFEGVLLKCKNEHEEKKLRFVSNIFANAAFLNVPAADANAILSMAERLTYRQICVLAAVGRLAEFREAVNLNPNHLFHLLRNGCGDSVLTAEVAQLQGSFSLLSETFEGHAILSDMGKRCFQFMELQGVSEEDITAIIQQAKASAGDYWLTGPELNNEK